LQTLTLGKHNPRLLEIRKAIGRAALTGDGFLPIEGPKLVEEAERSGLEIAGIFVRRGVNPPSIARAVPVYEIEASAFKAIQSTETSQGVIALVRPRSFSFTDILAVRNPLIVVLARLQDPGNVGTILRVAESFGSDACLATAGTASFLNSKTIRASAGSIFRLPHLWDLDFNKVVAGLKANNIRIAGTSPQAKETIDAWDWTEPAAIIIGNEGSGLSAEESRMCDTMLRIPVMPSVESLNSAIAAAVILYEAFRQRKNLQ
jgi:TrmH family RNA methyltransferase